MQVFLDFALSKPRGEFGRPYGRRTAEGSHSQGSVALPPRGRRPVRGARSRGTPPWAILERSSGAEGRDLALDFLRHLPCAKVRPKRAAHFAQDDSRRRAKLIRMEHLWSSEGLPQAEKEVDVRPLAEIWTRCPTGDRGPRCRGNRVVDIHRINGRIEVIAEVEANWADRRYGSADRRPERVRENR